MTSTGSPQPPRRRGFLRTAGLLVLIFLRLRARLQDRGRARFFSEVRRTLILHSRLRRRVKNQRKQDSTPASASPDHGLAEIKPNGGLNVILYLITFGLYAFLAGVATLTWNVPLVAGMHGFNVGGVPLIILGFCVVLTFKQIQTNERAAAYFYGTYVALLRPGPHLLPLGVNLYVAPMDLQTILEPGPRDKIFWGDEKEELPPGMVRPIFMNTRAPKPGEGEEGKEDRPLDVQMTVGLGYTVLWRITAPATFRANVHSIAEARRQIRTISETALAEVISKGTADDAIEGQASVNTGLRERLIELTSHWGIEVIQANLTNINLSHPLAKVMRDRAEATFIGQTNLIKAQFNAQARERLGEAEGKALRAETSGPLIGRAEGYGAIMKTLDVPGEKVLDRETVREALDGANLTVVGESSTVAGLGAMFEAGRTAGTPKQEGATR